jgi:hypothetical protein
MATNFKITSGKAKHSEAKEYIMEREYKKEARKVAGIEKELKKHERTDMAHAHPMHRSHEQKSQKDAPLPNMRKY